MSVLLQGPSDVGNRTLEMSGMMDAVIALCASEDVCHQQVAVEALIHAAGKAKRASFITANGVALLKDLYKKSENDRIRVRALVVSALASFHCCHMSVCSRTYYYMMWTVCVWMVLCLWTECGCVFLSYRACVSWGQQVAQISA